MKKRSYEVALAEENAVAHVQAMALRLLAAKKITRTELAASMGCSTAHVSQLLGDEPKNLTVKKAARLFYHLGEELVITCDSIDRLNREAAVNNARKASGIAASKNGFLNWRSVNSNEKGCDRVTTKQQLAA